MADKVNSIKTRIDPWGEALGAMSRENDILPVKKRKLLKDMLDKLPKKRNYDFDEVLIGDTVYRRLLIMDTDGYLIADYLLEMIDNIIYVRVPYRPRVSWFNWICSRLYMSRTPSVNVNVRR